MVADIVIGRRVSIAWSIHHGRAWFDGTVDRAYGTGRYLVKFDDGDERPFDLTKFEKAGSLIWLTNDVEQELQTQPDSSEQDPIRQAQREGLELIRSEASNSGFLGVRFCTKGRYLARRSGLTIGYFTTAEEAALQYARSGRSGEEQKAEPRLAEAPPDDGKS